MTAFNHYIPLMSDVSRYWQGGVECTACGLDLADETLDASYNACATFRCARCAASALAVCHP